MLTPTRREVIRALALAPLSAAGACCLRRYPKAEIDPSSIRVADRNSILTPARRLSRSAVDVIDTHAHFFNASDVPVKGFVAECLGHKAPDWLRPLIEKIAPIADAVARLAPTAREELDSLRALSQSVASRSAIEGRRTVDDWFQREREAAAERVVKAVAGSDFERRYREMVRAPFRGQAGISTEEVLTIASEARSRKQRGLRPQSPEDVRANAARAKLEFLIYMLSLRAANLRTYIDAYAAEDDQYAVDMVLGSLVDFDYWLDCPPLSAHDDQIVLHKHLAELHGGFLRPVVAYNPWTDLEQNDAGRKRVLAAWACGEFVGAKIYPPTGFLPAANETTPINSNKPHPDRKKLDGVLRKFFAMCADEGIPVLAHAARSNGRDDAHDEFSSPDAWKALMQSVSVDLKTPIISLGHFGGDDLDTDWTAKFAQLMKHHSAIQVFGDLGYWDQLMCTDTAACTQTRDRLKTALAVPVAGAETVADRVMFATDWLMLSQVTDWQTYPQRVREALDAIATAEDVVKILGKNARRCFARLPR